MKSTSEATTKVNQMDSARIQDAISSAALLLTLANQEPTRAAMHQIVREMPDEETWMGKYMPGTGPDLSLTAFAVKCLKIAFARLDQVGGAGAATRTVMNFTSLIRLNTANREVVCQHILHGNYRIRVEICWPKDWGDFKFGTTVKPLPEGDPNRWEFTTVNQYSEINRSATMKIERSPGMGFHEGALRQLISHRYLETGLAV